MQYRPEHKAHGHDKLGRPVTLEEFHKAVKCFMDRGIKRLDHRYEELAKCRFTGDKLAALFKDDMEWWSKETFWGSSLVCLLGLSTSSEREVGSIVKPSWHGKNISCKIGFKCLCLEISRLCCCLFLQSRSDFLCKWSVNTFWKFKILWVSSCTVSDDFIRLILCSHAI